MSLIKEFSQQKTLVQFYPAMAVYWIVLIVIFRFANFLFVVFNMKKVSILGSTGSIGLNTLDVISSLKDNYSLFGISCKTNTLLLHQQIIKYNPKVAVITDSEKYHEFTKKHGKKIETKILFNSDGLDEISSSNDVDIVVASIVGFECLKPVIKAIKNDKTVMIANKEILVSAGEMLMSFKKIPS